jgi:predicted membrane protein
MKAKYQQYYLRGLLLVFLLYHAPTIFLGPAAFFNAFDSLDSFVVWYRLATQNAYAWAPPYETIEPFMGGVPKFTLVSTYNVYYWLNLLLPTFTAFQAYNIFISAVALLGMWLLCRRHLGINEPASAFLALSFAFTPFLPTWGLSIAGQPLLLFVILNIRQGRPAIWNWLVLGAFPFTSNFQSAGVFILSAFGILIGYDVIQKRPVKRLILAFAILLAVYLITKIDLIQNLIGGEGFVSHRMEMRRFPVSLGVCFKIFARYFLLGNVDVALSLHTFVLLPFVCLVYAAHVIRKKELPLALTGTVAIIVLICFYIAILNWEPVVGLRNSSDLLRMFSLERFHIFLQLLWHIAAAQALLLIVPKYQSRVLMVVATMQLAVCFAYQPTYYERFVKKFVSIVPYHYIFTYEDYYAERMFDNIKTAIGKPVESYRVASIGIPPAVAQYNGMWTIDGYSSNYPLPYKHQFRNIIAAELEKNGNNRGFFDFWGSQSIVVYDQGLPYFETHMTRGMAPSERPITLSHEALRKLRCDYILSAENIREPEKSGLRKLAIFRSAIWHVNLYEVINAQ